MTPRLSISVLLVPALSLALAGCNPAGARPAVAPVSGKVTYKGAAVEGALVSFIPDGSVRVATGMTNASGEYKLTTFSSNDGAIPATHSITVTKTAPATAGAAGGPAPSAMKPEDYAKMMQNKGAGGGGGLAPPITAAKPDASIPAKYGDPQKSGLKRTVVQGESNVFDIELTD